jgi:tight adherence protein B
MAVLLAMAAAYGAFLIYTYIAFGWHGVGPGPSLGTRRKRRRQNLSDWLRQAGIESEPGSLVAVVVALFVIGAAFAYALFDGPLPAIAAGLFAATFPLASARTRRDRRRAESRDAWPRLIEEIRLGTGSLGRSIPTALFDVGRHAPDEMQPAFHAAEREWLLSTDFARTVAVLEAQLADGTADAVCETLLVAHDLGGADLDRRLMALAEDRIQDLQGRKDARARQAGVRFARRFVLIVPVGMALAGLSIGTGRAAYRTAMGQVAIVIGIMAIVACWLWAGLLMRLPEEERVFGDVRP